MQSSGSFHGFVAIGGFTANLPAVFGLEKMPQEAPYYLMIIHHENANMVHVERSTITVAPVRRANNTDNCLKAGARALAPRRFQHGPQTRVRGPGLTRYPIPKTKSGEKNFVNRAKRSFDHSIGGGDLTDRRHPPCYTFGSSIGAEQALKLATGAQQQVLSSFSC
jgi:hypothetical protein